MVYILSLFLVLVLIPTILLYLHLTRNFNHWKNKNVSYIKPLPIFGNVYKILTMQQCIGDFLRDLYNMTKQPFFGFFIFDKPFLLIRDPEIIKKCLVKDFEHFDDRSVMENPRDDKLGSYILFVLKNPAWKEVRAKFTPVFSTGKSRGMLNLMLEASNDLVDHINNIAVKLDATDTRELSMKFTTDIIASCAFGIYSHCFRNEKAAFREVSRRIFDYNILRKCSMAAYFFAPVLVKLFKLKFLEPNAVKFIEDVFDDTMNERLKTKSYRGDLIDTLIEVTAQSNPGDCQFEGRMLTAQAVQFFVAGFETTGSTISFTLYELSLNTSIQDHLRDEIRNAVKKHGGITYEAIQDMEYLDMTVKETLRKYPPLPSYLDRRCKKPYKIPGTDVVIEKGVPVYISLLGLHFDPQYFPNPEKFEPERFTAENMASVPSFCYMPFGAGQHNCIGARFGLLGTKVALIKILHDFEVEVCKETPVSLEFDPKGFLLAPKTVLNLHYKRKV